MANTGVLEHSPGLQGGVLRLFEQEGELRLVLAGPLQGFPQQGVVAVYGRNMLLAKLHVAETNDGRLSLRVDNGVPTPVETVVLEAGSVDELQDYQPRARLLLKDAERPGRSIELGFDDDGPYIKLQKDRQENTVKLTVDRGLEVPRFIVANVVDHAAEE